MKIGLTGGTGFIGSNFIHMYSNKYDIIPVSSNRKETPFILCDYSVESYRHAFKNVDCIVHLGAKVQDSANEIGNIKDYMQNIQSTENLLKAMQINGIKKIIFISSVYVYGKQKIPYVEDMSLMPQNCYGISKASTEYLIEAYKNKMDLNSTILRVGQVLGMRTYENRGFFSMLMENAAGGRDITLYAGTENAARDYIYVDDVCRAIDYALERDVNGTFNISGGKPITNYDLAKIYCEVFESTSDIKIISKDNCSDKQFWYMDVEKAKKCMQWEPHYMIKDIVEAIKQKM